MDMTEIKEIIREEIHASVTSAMKETMEKLESKWNEKYNSLKADLKSNKETQEETLTRIVEDVKYTTSGLQQLEEYSRKENVIIRGLDMKNDESEEELMQKVEKLARSLGVDLQEVHVSTLHRLPTQSTSAPPPVIVRLVNRWKKEQLIRASKEKRLKGIYISHQLTPEKFGLLRRALELKRNGRVKYVWTTGNKILARITDNDRSIEVTGFDTLIKLGWKEEAEAENGSAETDEENTNQNEALSSKTLATEKKEKKQPSSINDVLGKKNTRANELKEKMRANKLETRQTNRKKNTRH